MPKAHVRREMDHLLCKLERSSSVCQRASGPYQGTVSLRRKRRKVGVASTVRPLG